MTGGERVLSADVLTEALTADRLDSSDIVEGSPRVASAELDATSAAAIGVWEITEGTVTDTEVDEVFLVLSGTGQITFDDGSVVALRPGTLVRLRAGDHTTWTINEKVRKVYVVLPTSVPEARD
jgi:hypothetical protein